MSLEQKTRLMIFPKPGRFILVIFSLALFLVGIRAFQLYSYIYKPDVQKEYILFIRRGATLEMVRDSLVKNQVIGNLKAFLWVAKKKEYRDPVKPGRFHLKKGMNHNTVVNMLRSGLQEPVQLTFNNVRTKEQLAAAVSRYIDSDSLSVADLFQPEITAEYGFTPETFPAMFIPNTYEFYWTTSARQFADRMKLEYSRFWDEERKKKAENIGLTPEQVATLASIVQEETNQREEKPRVAGVYINRLQRGMLLQADPTVKFAVGDVTLRRILNSHLEIDSPYNTYRYQGLPPGPITFPEISSLEAVLNYERHSFLYFCAREDFSGFHNFARTIAEHARNAARYHAALNALNRNRD